MGINLRNRRFWTESTKLRYGIMTVTSLPCAKELRMTSIPQLTPILQTLLTRTANEAAQATGFIPVSYTHLTLPTILRV